MNSNLRFNPYQEEHMSVSKVQENLGYAKKEQENLVEKYNGLETERQKVRMEIARLEGVIAAYNDTIGIFSVITPAVEEDNA